MCSNVFFWIKAHILIEMQSFIFRSLKVCVSMQINTVEDDIVKGKQFFTLEHLE